MITPYDEASISMDDGGAASIPKWTQLLATENYSSEMGIINLSWNRTTPLIIRMLKFHIHSWLCVCGCKKASEQHCLNYFMFPNWRFLRE